MGGAQRGGSGGAPSGGDGGSNSGGSGGALGNVDCVGSIRSGDEPCAKDASCLNDFNQYCFCSGGIWACGNV